MSISDAIIAKVGQLTALVPSIIEAWKVAIGKITAQAESIAHLQSTNAELNLQLQASQDLNNKTHSDLQDALNRLTNGEVTIADLQENLNALSASNSSMQETINALKANNAEQQAELEKLTSTPDDIANNIHAITDAILAGTPEGGTPVIDTPPPPAEDTPAEPQPAE